MTRGYYNETGLPIQIKGYGKGHSPWNTGIPWSEEVKKKLRGKRPHTAGENNHAWVGGKYGYWKKECIKRDNHICQDCKIQYLLAGMLDVHHLKSKSKYPELRYDLNNGITLCPNCHRIRTLQQKKVNYK
jgi:hypothetical protein